VLNLDSFRDMLSITTRVGIYAREVSRDWLRTGDIRVAMVG
jgi:hypothetical protein